MQNDKAIDKGHSQLIDDLLMLDSSENVIECTAGNIFWFANGIWYTPCVKTSGVDGVMRRFVIDFFRTHNIDFEIGEFTVNNLKESESVFICNAIKHFVVVSS